MIRNMLGQGRIATTSLTGPATAEVRTSVNHYTRLSNGSIVTLSVPRRTGTSTYTYYSPVSYTVAGLNGQLEASGTIAFTGGNTTTEIADWIDETETSGTLPISAVDVGTVAHLTTTAFNENGSHAVLQKAYSSITTPTTEDTAFTYDVMGRPMRTVDPTGTIARSMFDALGRGSTTWIGTDDTGWPGGMTGGSDNMTKTASVVYDAGGVGNSVLTAKTNHVDSNSAHDRTTSFLSDYRGRARVTIGELPPYAAVALDNLGRVTSAAQYVDDADLSATYGSVTDPAATSSDPAIGDRRALSKNFYDTRGNIWKAERFDVNGSGVLSDSISALNWYDAAGRLIKSRASTLSKTIYDRMGRGVRSFVLASDDDADYDDVVDGVVGDVVMEESQTYLDSTTGNALLAVTIKRHPNDSSTTGALDTDTDLSLVDYSGNKIKGRVDISSFYYEDALDRQTHSVAIGTNGGTNYDRDSVTTSPSTSSTILVSISRFNPDGTTLESEDPLGRVMRNYYDALSRTVKTIANYENGTPGSTGSEDDDQVIEYEFTNGLMTKMIARMPSSSDDQATIYTYGVQKSGANSPLSSVADNRLLRKVQYPDSSGSSDGVRYAYNAIGEQTVTLDQAGNQIETEYDDLGRQLDRRATTIAAGFDNLVRRIGITYDDLGRTSTVSQYDVSSVVLDQVKYEYDGWGNLIEFEQDVDSSIGAGTGRAEFSVGYAFVKSVPSDGAHALRRSSMKHNGSDIFSYVYGTSGSVHDKMSRVGSLSMSSVTVASYTYSGARTLVTTSLDEAGVSSTVFDASGTTYPGWDRFSRPVESTWQNDASSVRFYDTAIRYDENSNITETVDNLHVINATSKHIFDVLYANDALNRLRDAHQGNIITNGSSQREVESGTAKRREQWNDLSLTGNWGNRKLDGNGDGAYTSAGDLDETNNVFTKANEWTDRRSRATPTQDDWEYTHDAVGNLAEEELSRYNGSVTAVSGRAFVYDAFGRLRKVERRPVIVGQDPTIIEYRYNGFGFRTMWKYDATPGGGLTNDERYYFLYDEKWRTAATYRNSDVSAKERFVHHAAGRAGTGSSSYIDSVVLRDRDNTSGWTAASDGTLEERHYYCQNWRSDVVTMIEDDGQPVEWVRYSPYGEPTTYLLADYNRDGVVNSTDYTVFDDEFQFGGSVGALTADLDFSGSIDTDDLDRFNESLSEFSGLSGIGFTSRIGNRLGYAGYHWDSAGSLYHVRYRVYRPDLGRWMQRDPIAYIDGMNLYQYASSKANILVDSLGLNPVLVDQAGKLYAQLTLGLGLSEKAAAIIVAKAFGVTIAALATGFHAQSILNWIEAGANAIFDIPGAGTVAIIEAINRIKELTKDWGCKALRKLYKKLCGGDPKSCNDKKFPRDLTGQARCDELAARRDRARDCLYARVVYTVFCGGDDQKGALSPDETHRPQFVEVFTNWMDCKNQHEECVKCLPPAKP
jgi:RHS repeat-associated protein